VNHRETHRPLDSWSPAAPDAAQALTTAKNVAKVGVIGDTAGEKRARQPIRRS
jgi:hypothetical protein